MIPKKLALTVANGIVKKFDLKIITRHLISKEMATPEGKAIFDNLAKCFLAKAEIPNENQFHGAALNNNKFDSF